TGDVSGKLTSKPGAGLLIVATRTSLSLHRFLAHRPDLTSKWGAGCEFWPKWPTFEFSSHETAVLHNYRLFVFVHRSSSTIARHGRNTGKNGVTQLSGVMCHKT